MAQMSLCDELLSQQQETVNSFIRSLEEEISKNSQQAQRLMEQSSSNLPKSIIGQVEALIAKEQQNASKLQILEEINKEATEIAEEQHCRLKEARLNLTTPLTSEVEASEAEGYGGARPKVKSRAQATTVTPNVYPKETVAKKYDSHCRVIVEALYIRVNNPSLNRNIGKYHLPHIWDVVLYNISELKLE